jgi:type II secretory pathway pseudopilin PulG
MPRLGRRKPLTGRKPRCAGFGRGYWKAGLTGRGLTAGFTVLELVLGIALLGTLALVMAQLFRTTMAANLRTASETLALKNARVALAGDGPFHGLVYDTLFSSYVYAANGSSMTLVEVNQSSTTILMSPYGSLLATNSSNSSWASHSATSGLSNLALTYYAVDSSFHFSTTTTPSSAQLVTFSFQVPRKGRTLQFYSGSSVKNTR